jgi:hypothetical protein
MIGCISAPEHKPVTGQVIEDRAEGDRKDICRDVIQAEQSCKNLHQHKIAGKGECAVSKVKADNGSARKSSE